METSKMVLLMLILQNLSLSCKGQNYGDPLPPPPHTLQRSNRGTVNVPAVTTSTISLDTHAVSWTSGQIDTLGSDQGIAWSTRIEGRSLGSMAKSNHHLFSASFYSDMDVRDSIRHLIIEVQNESGTVTGTSRISNKVGYSTICMVGNGDYVYLMYNEELSPSSRDLYVAKIDTNATILWSTRLGKRVSTFGNGLMNIHPDGRVIVLSNNYEPVHIDALDPSSGAILKSHRLDFPYDMNVSSSVINDAGHVVALATQIYYIGWNGYTSIFVFELDKSFNVIRQQYLNSNLEDWSEEILIDSKGNYIIQVRSEFESQIIKERFEIHILGILDKNFQLLHQQGIKVVDDASHSRIFFKDNIYLCERNNREFNIHVLNPSLQLQRTYVSKGDYFYPDFIGIGSGDRAWVGGYAGSMWFVELGFGK